MVSEVSAATGAATATATAAAILDGALAAVNEHGIRRTSAADIARRSGVSRQTIYRYWPDVRSLFGALITRELVAVIDAAPAPPDSLDAFVDALVDVATSVRDLPIIARLRETDPELFAQYILERLGSSQRAILADLTTRLRAAQRTGIVRNADAGQMAAMILLIAQSAVQSAPLVEPWLPDDAWAQQLRHALRGYLAPDGA